MATKKKSPAQNRPDSVCALLKAGTITASGTLAQAIPPSLVLIVLADQLGNDLAAAAQVDFEAPVFVYEDEPAPEPREARRGARPGAERRASRGDSACRRDTPDRRGRASPRRRAGARPSRRSSS